MFGPMTLSHFLRGGEGGNLIGIHVQQRNVFLLQSIIKFQANKNVFFITENYRGHFILKPNISPQTPVGQIFIQRISIPAAKNFMYSASEKTRHQRKHLFPFCSSDVLFIFCVEHNLVG